MNITIRMRNLFYVTFGVFLLVFLYMVRSVLVPFIIAMIFAYVFNPLINFFHRKFRVPRSLSILLVYLLLIITVVLLGIFLTRTVVGEADDIAHTFNQFFISAKNGVSYLPDWIRPSARDYLGYLSKNQLNVVSVSPFPLFTRAFSGILSLFVTFFAAFFFLKDNTTLLEWGIQLFPSEYRTDARTLFKRINTGLARYLRGQMILISSMIVMLYLCFTILGVKYALTLSVLSALFEIVPLMGPIFAGILGTAIIIISGGSQNFGLNLYQTVGIVVLIYYITRQIQDYLIAPYIMSRVTQLHPLVILFSVLAGQHLYGVVGVLLAVPIVASLKITYEFVLERIREEDHGKVARSK